MNTCEHGDRIKRTGTNSRGNWTGWFCPQPKGSSDQCPPVFDRAANNTARAVPVGAAPAPGETVVVLKKILAVLEKLEAKTQGSVMQVSPPELTSKPLPDAEDDVSTEELPF